MNYSGDAKVVKLLKKQVQSNCYGPTKNNESPVLTILVKKVYTLIT